MNSLSSHSQKKQRTDHPDTYCIGFGQTISQLEYDNILNCEKMLSEQQLDFMFQSSHSLIPNKKGKFIKFLPCYFFQYLDGGDIERIHAFLDLFFDERNVHLLIVPIVCDGHCSALVFLKGPTVVPVVISFDSKMNTGFQHSHKYNLEKIIRYGK